MIFCCLVKAQALHFFADDMLLYKPIRSIDDFIEFQSDVNAVVNWVTRNFLTLNTSKTKSMIISRKRLANEFPQLVIDGSIPLTELLQSNTWAYI